MGFNHNTNTYNIKAAEIIVPLIINEFHPTSVLDVGCGIGTWLSVFQKHNISDFLGVDGNYVDKKLLNKYIEDKYFYAFNLINELNLNRKYDIVLSLEVAEHIEEKFADNFIKTLINHGEVIVFSAAIPLQGGQNHVNEQWPSYWVGKFKKYNYFVHDIIRPKIWDEKKIEYWYRQNILVFKKEEQSNTVIIDAVLPDFYIYRVNQLEKKIESFQNYSLGFLYYFKMSLGSIKNKIIRIWKKQEHEQKT